MKKLSLILLILLISGYLSAQDRDYIKWVKARNGEIPANAVIGGEENGQPLYIARAMYKGGIHPGKIGKGWKGCNISYGGLEIESKEYEILVYNDLDRNQRTRVPAAADEMRKVMDSFSNDRKLGTTIKDSETRSLSSQLAKVQETALSVKNYKLNDNINDMRKYLTKRNLKRDDIKKKLTELYEISKNSD